MQGVEIGQRQSPAQLGLQRLLKHVVVTKPPIQRVERNTEQPFSLQQIHERAPVELTRCLAIGPADRIHELGTKPVQNRGSQQVVTHFRRLPLQHLADQIRLNVR